MPSHLTKYPKGSRHSPFFARRPLFRRTARLFFEGYTLLLIVLTLVLFLGCGEGNPTWPQPQPAGAWQTCRQALADQEVRTAADSTNILLHKIVRGRPCADWLAALGN